MYIPQAQFFISHWFAGKSAALDGSGLCHQELGQVIGHFLGEYQISIHER